MQEAAKTLTLLAAALAAVLCAAPRAVAGERLTVFAAASLAEAMGDLERAWEERTGDDVTTVLAGTATLARQIASGAPADVVVSANADWMAWLDDNGHILPGSARVIATNRLVLVTPAPLPGSGDAPPAPVGAAMFDRLGPDGRLAMALTDAVPAGIYGRAALEAIGLWPALAPRVAETDSVRGALAFVATGEAPLGIVYESDARAEGRVAIVGRFDPAGHPPILYPAAAVAGSPAPDRARAFVTWLSEPQAQAILAARGLGHAPDPQDGAAAR